MNRPIKFRAWDKINKRFENPQDFTVMGTGKYAIWYGQPHGYEAEKNDESRLVVMQFTGLTDNRVEMYEGDVLSIGDKYTETVDVGVGSVPVAQWEENHIAVIEFRDGEFGVEITEDKELLSRGWYSLKTLREEGYEKEVIGNRFENPELLTK